MVGAISSRAAAANNFRPALVFCTAADSTVVSVVSFGKIARIQLNNIRVHCRGGNCHLVLFLCLP
jgi:hypothetical protein